jgi:hypothetical protein
MYNSNYNRRIAEELHNINKKYIKHQHTLEGEGYSGSGLLSNLLARFPLAIKNIESKPFPKQSSEEQTGQRQYIKGSGKKAQHNQCPHCQGSGWLQNTLKEIITPTNVAKLGKVISTNFLQSKGVSGSGISGSGVSGGKKRGRKPKVAVVEGEGWGFYNPFSVKTKSVAKKIPNAPPKSPPMNIKAAVATPTIAAPAQLQEPQVSQPKVGGRHKQKQKPAGSGRPRGNPNLKKRAEIVKQVMKEQGLSMIQASQYVKHHNLF